MRPRTRLPFVVALVLVCLLAACADEPPAYVLGPHPIVVLDISSLRADRLQPYGYDRETTPHLAALAEESIVFEWAFTASPDGVPAQATILTGSYPPGHGVLSDSGTLADEVVTLAERLQDLGYETAAFVDGGYLSEGFGLSQGFDLYDDSRGKGLETVAPKALDWLRDRRGNWFLLIHASDALPPFAPSAEARRRLAADVAVDAAVGVQELAALGRAISVGGEAPANGELESAAQLYDAELRTVDAQLGRLLDGLRETGVLDRATLVVVSDHGQELGEHAATLNRGVYATVTRVPLLLRLPGGRDARRVESVAETVAIAPTLLELLGESLPPEMQGDSLLSQIYGPGDPPYMAFTDWARADGALGVAMDGWHLIVHRVPADAAEGTEPRVELYHLTEDPLEQVDRAADEPQRVAVLRRRLEAWQGWVAAGLGAGEGERSMEQDALDALKELGYIQN